MARGPFIGGQVQGGINTLPGALVVGPTPNTTSGPSLSVLSQNVGAGSSAIVASAGGTGVGIDVTSGAGIVCGISIRGNNAGAQSGLVLSSNGSGNGEVINRVAGSDLALGSNSSTYMTIKNGGDILSRGSGYAKYKSAAESRTATSTFANDAHLVGWSLAASTTYAIQGWLNMYATVSSTNGIKWTFTYSGSLAASVMTDIGALNATATTDLIPVTPITNTRNVTTLTTTTTGDWVNVSGFISTSTAGTLNFQWAQSNPANITWLLAGSYFNLIQLS